MNPRDAQRSALVDLKDPIQVHLLTETALSDSKGYEILSQEEVDDLKKQMQSLTMRIEQTRTNLAIQSKYRDAAISMAKLYSPAKPDGKKLSLRSSNRLSDSAREAEMEKQASERRCEELAAELFRLEKNLMEPQRRLLQHTAAILQVTHRASTKKPEKPPPGQLLPNGIPGSPESLYTYTNARNSVEASSGADFEDKNLYLPLEQMDGQPRKNLIEIPMKSPIREQNSQLREEMDRVKEENIRLVEENARLKEAQQKFIAEIEALQTQSSGQIGQLTDTENKLEALARGLREVILAYNPAEDGELGRPGNSLASKLDYLERGLAAAADGRAAYEARLAKEGEAALASAAAAEAEAALAQAEGRVEGLIGQLQDVISQSNIGQQLPPEPAEGTLIDQLTYVENAIRVIGDELSRAFELSASASSSRQNSDQIEAVLSGLWDIIQSGLVEAQQQKAARRKMRLEQGLDLSEEDMSGDEAVDPNESYSLQAFSAKVQWLFAQATSLKEQKTVLKRQIKQQRELNSKSGSEKDQELRNKMDELEQARSMLAASDRRAAEAQERVAQMLADMEMLQQTNAANESASARAMEDQLKERTEALAGLEARYQETQAQLQAAEASAETLQSEIKDKDDEIDRMNMMVIELKTEVAFAKAELDGAYGSRKQRAAEAAAMVQSGEVEELTVRVAQLEAELTSTLRDLEDMTRDSIAAEKEKLDLEGRLDDAEAAKASFEAELRAAQTRLDAEVARLQEQLDAERLKVPPSPAALGTAGGTRVGAALLSEQFRTTMKKERKKFQEELRVSFFLVFVYFLPE